MKKFVQYSLMLSMSFVLGNISLVAQVKKDPQIKNEYKIDLSGGWLFQVDSLDEGVQQQWFNKNLKDKIHLPGSMTTNGKGNDVDVNTPWTGGIVDSSWFFKPQYAQYRKKGNIKVPFWLQPIKYYKGAAWYQKTVNIPSSWKQKHLELFIERSHWETTVWIDNKEIGMQNSLGTSHVFDLTKALTPGSHKISVRVDNRVKEFNVGENSHSISDHTQSNWNGMVGKLFIAARPSVYIDDIQLLPNLKNKEVAVHIIIKNSSGAPVKSTLELLAVSDNSKAEKLKGRKLEIEVKADSAVVDAVYPMGNNPLLWDEFHPNLYSFKVRLTSGRENAEERNETFGMREFLAKGTQFTINGNLTFLRGTLECAIFPKTGFPPTDTASWMHVFKVCRSYGLNHMRFHSWCPPEAAFEAADRSGFYIQVECSSWANQDATIGDGKPLDEYIYDESRRMAKAYGNHPSFVMMLYGNEPAGKNHVKYLTDFVNYWKQRDSRRLYTTGAGWPIIAESNYNSTPDPRIQAWGAGLKSIINSQPPKSDYDWSNIISKWQHPTVSHEIGQWCVYPDFKEIAKYTGVLKAKNFEIFRDKLVSNGLGNLADSFLLSSGKLQALCYKADIEAALRTPGFGGFQLLDLHDFPGQGTALVGVLNPFWEDKGYITSKEYSQFCNSTVPLARLPKMIYTNNEELLVPIEIAHFGEAPINNITPEWTIKDASGKTLFNGTLAKTTIPVGNGFKLGNIQQALSSLKTATQLVLTVSIGNHQNSWDIFVYPASYPAENNDVVVTQDVDKAMQVLNSGGKVLLTIKKGSLKPEKGGDVAIGFSSIFWNTAWTHGQPPTTLGILCNPKHPALKNFPTKFYSNWQWWDGMSHSQPILLDSVSKGLQPIVRVIDDWVTARSLGLIFECQVGKGKLIVSGIDLVSDAGKRPEARQLLHSLKTYMAQEQFKPVVKVAASSIEGLTK
ncbi:glycoside hydrolase family 2 [Segetibacter koreensis]|uniref:glycoside hydrolase family 2 n=1 Tax=Segetibacter koreensis TaxID=398037 RepID=UPI0003663A51|nr:glycoside hydrolase family 2 [Segetibacter koreensis]